MSQSYDEYDDNENDTEYEPEPEPEPTFVKRLRNDAKAGKAAAARVKELEAEMVNTRALQQELAMRRAQIDPDSALAKMFVKANPDLVDVDAIKSEWEKVATAYQPPADEDAAALARINAAQSGGTPSGGAAPDFDAELDAIPEIVNGEWNPGYVQQVLSATQVQAAREGREFVTSQSGKQSWQTSGVVTKPLA